MSDAKRDAALEREAREAYQKAYDEGRDHYCDGYLDGAQGHGDALADELEQSGVWDRKTGKRLKGQPDAAREWLARFDFDEEYEACEGSGRSARVTEADLYAAWRDCARSRDAEIARLEKQVVRLLDSQATDAKTIAELREENERLTNEQAGLKNAIDHLEDRLQRQRECTDVFERQRDEARRELEP